MASPNIPVVQPPDWKDVLDFVRNQGEKDRAYFDQLFRRTMWAIGIIVATGIGLATFFGLRSLADMKEEMKRQTQAEIGNMRAEVRKRIDAEFQTPEITRLVQTVARERASEEINRIIFEQVSRQVQAAVKGQEGEIRKAVSQETQGAVARLGSTIDEAVAKQIRPKVETSLRPLELELARYQEVLNVGAIANAAMNGSRAAYFQLKPALTSKNPQVQEIAVWATLALNDEQMESLKSQGLNPALTSETLTQLSSSASPTLRAKVVEAMGKSLDRKYIPRVIEMIKSDPNLRVLRAALIAFSQLTKSNFSSDEDGIEKAQEWWTQHKSEFKQ
jgi:hypothetical protein